MWARRILLSCGLAAASIMVVPAVSGAASTDCYPSCTAPTVSANSNGPSPDGSSTSDGGSPAAAATTLSDGSSSLPFTGADIEELAVVGVAAVVAGGLLTRRRRRAA
jgi:LPXTG-motif cell wall-anchored protein